MEWTHAPKLGRVPQPRKRKALGASCPARDAEYELIDEDREWARRIAANLPPLTDRQRDVLALLTCVHAAGLARSVSELLGLLASFAPHARVLNSAALRYTDTARLYAARRMKPRSHNGRWYPLWVPLSAIWCGQPGRGHCVPAPREPRGGARRRVLRAARGFAGRSRAAEGRLLGGAPRRGRTGRDGARYAAW